MFWLTGGDMTQSESIFILMAFCLPFLTSIIISVVSILIKMKINKSSLIWLTISYIPSFILSLLVAFIVPNADEFAIIAKISLFAMMIFWIVVTGLFQSLRHLKEMAKQLETIIKKENKEN